MKVAELMHTPVVDEFGSAHSMVALDDLVRMAGRQVEELGDLLRDQAPGLHLGL